MFLQINNYISTPQNFLNFQFQTFAESTGSGKTDEVIGNYNRICSVRKGKYGIYAEQF